MTKRDAITVRRFLAVGAVVAGVVGFETFVGESMHGFWRDSLVVLPGHDSIEAAHHAPPTFAGRIWDTMADNTSTPVDEAHGFEPHHDQHVYFRKLDKPEDQLRPFSPMVTCKHDK